MHVGPTDSLNELPQASAKVQSDLASLPLGLDVPALRAIGAAANQIDVASRIYGEAQVAEVFFHGGLDKSLTGKVCTKPVVARIFHG